MPKRTHAILQIIATLLLLTASLSSFAALPVAPIATNCNGVWNPNLTVQRIEWEPRPQFLMDELLKAPLASRGIKQRPKSIQLMIRSNAKLSYSSPLSERIAAVPNLGVIFANPGHAPIRSPFLVDELQVSIQNSGYLPEVDPKQRPTLNIITNESGTPLVVDAVGGHHRFFAAIAELMRVRGISANAAFSIPLTEIFDLGYLIDLEIAINGVRPDGTQMSRRLPAQGLDLTQTSGWKAVAQSETESVPYRNDQIALESIADPIFRQMVKKRIILLRADKGENSGELLLSPSLSNYQAGSRDTLETAYQTMTKEYHPKIGVARYDESASVPTSAELARWARLEIDEVVILWSGPSPSAAIIFLESANEKLAAEGFRFRFNLYRGPHRAFIQLFGEESLLGRLKQAYSTPYTIEKLNPLTRENDAPLLMK